EIFSWRDRRDVGHEAGERCLDNGMIELALRLLDLRLRLQILRMLRRGDLRITAEPGELHLRLLAQRFELALVGGERGLRLVVYRLRNGAAAQERNVAIVVDLIQIDLRLLGRDIAE